MKTSRHILFIFLFLGLFFSLQGQEVKGSDPFWTSPRGTFEERKQQYINYCTNEGDTEGQGGRTIIFKEITRVAGGLPIDEKRVQETLDVIYYNRDCNDFTLNGLLRLEYQNREKAILSKEMNGKVEDCILDFKYWWDDARRDTTYKCYHTENHQALYHTAELLAGQLYKDKVFKDGMTGVQHMDHAKERLVRWLDFRFRFGFSEWLSATYYDVEVLLLCNLYDYAEDPLIRSRAGLVLDMLMFDLALNNYKGVLGPTTGRIYAPTLLTYENPISPVMKLVFGVGQYLPRHIMGSTALVTTAYRCPEVITKIGTDYSVTMRNRQRNSIEVADAPKYGLSYDNELDTHLFWGMQEFIHPLAIRMSKHISETHDAWPYRDYDHYIKIYDDQIAKYGKVTTPNLDRFALSEANIETYRTPDYMISCASDFRPGAIGYQQHPWQATLGSKALVFTNHPGSEHLNVTPNYWAGNAVLPRAAQHKNVVVCIYNTPKSEKLHFTHAYVPKDAFDEVIEKGSWVFARKDDGYIAIYSQNKTQWKANEEGVVNDLIADGLQNIWIFEMGSKKESGSFSKFVDMVSKSKVVINNQDVTYNSPSQGQIEFGWGSPFKIKGKEVSLKVDYRYDNPYSKTLFNTRKMEIKKGRETLILDFENGKQSIK